MKKITFLFRSAFLGTSHYDCIGAEETPFIVCFRTSADDYERSITNHSVVDWKRDVLDEIGVLHRYISSQPLPVGVVEAFNASRLELYLRAMKMLDSQPEKYGFIPADDPIRKPPMTAKAGHFVVGIGWVTTSQAEAHAAAA